MKQTINCHGIDINFELTRTNRKTVGIKIIQTGLVKVTAPQGLDTDTLMTIIYKKSDWILKKIEDLQIKNSQINYHNYDNGEIFYFLNKPFTLVVKNMLKKGVKVSLSDNKLNVLTIQDKDLPITKELLKKAICNFYIDTARKYITNRVGYYSTKIGVKPAKLSMRNQKTRWGSCSSKGNISVNWRLIMAPAEVIDYIVIHELCHLKEMNHSTKFWQYVQKYCPEYISHERWLKENGHKLVI